MNKVQNSTLNMPVSSKDKAKDWQLEILMEKLRSKASQFKTLPDISKNVRMTLLDKRFALDSVDKSQHQKCLDTLQHVIKVTSLQTMLERLESLSRQQGLHINIEPSNVVFIHSDMFYLEIILEATGAVKDVKIHHEVKGEMQSCTELINCLSRGDFTDFIAQLEGLASIYRLNADKLMKGKAFMALEALEADLCTLAQFQSSIKEPFNLLHKSHVGLFGKRRGGHPMKLTYFVSPYDLVNVEKYDIDNINIDMIISKGLGHWVAVCIESSTSHKLQISTLITVGRNTNGKSTPLFSPVTSLNSANLPACFVLKLSKPLPMCVSLIRKIQQIQQEKWQEIDQNPPQALLNLIVNHYSEGKMSSNNNQGLFVTLPDQTHCYFMTENPNMQGIYVSSIPFTHPIQVSQLLMTLREQALFNTIIGSCVRPNSHQSFENMTMFEISVLSPTQISISLENPLKECMSTVDLDLSDISNLICKIHSASSEQFAENLQPKAPDLVSELATRVLNKTFSIPITLRAVLKAWEREAALPKLTRGHENFSLPLGSIDPGGHNNNNNNNKGSGGSSGSNNLTEFGGLQDNKIKQEPGSVKGPQHQQQQQHGHHQHHHQHQQSLNHHHQHHQQIILPEHQSIWNETMMSSNFPNIPPSDRPLTNLELANILSDSPEKSTSTKKHKRSRTTNNDDLWKCGNNKRKVGASSEDSEFLETSSCDSTSRSTPISQETGAATPNSGSQSDFELSNVDSCDFLSTIEKTSGEFSLRHAETVDMDEILSSLPSMRKTHHQERSPSSSTSSILSDFSGKMPPNVSITPVSSTPSPTFLHHHQSGMNDKRMGIEIIPITQQATSSLLPTSITITPIPSSNAARGGSSASDDRREYNNKKSSSSSSGSGKSNRDDREKKRKRKRDESPMGPPDKVPPNKQDPLSKPVSVSIKPAESPPLLLTGSTPPSPSNNMIRKFSPSPTSSSSSSSSSANRQLSGKLSPSLLKAKSSSSSHSPSPKNSPAHIPSSPKHGFQISSPKHHGTSPKHPSLGGSGKPSMSALKNAASSSPSSKSSNEKVKSNKDGRDKEKNKSSMFGSSSGNGKSKPSISSSSSSSLKMKPLDLNLGNLDSLALEQSLPSPTSGIDAKGNSNSTRNRKGSLSAIVDKLSKNAQQSDIPTDLTITSKSTSSNKSLSKDGKSMKQPSSGDIVKNSEYMVKTNSSDGMKLTINKPRTKENKSGGGNFINSSNQSLTKPLQITTTSLSSSSTTTTTGSQKVHTGLKPGVTSGPASKKPQQIQKSSSSSTILNSSSTTYTPTNSSSIKSSSISSSGTSSGSSKFFGNNSNLSKSANAIGNKISKTITSPKLTSVSPSSSSSSSSTCGGGNFADLNRANKERFKSGGKTAIEKSFFSSMKEQRGKGSPTSSNDTKMDFHPSSLLLMEGGKMKTLDKNFQIPKLSDKKKNETSNNSIQQQRSSTVDTTKLFDMMMVKNDLKYHHQTAIPPTGHHHPPIEIPAMNSLEQKIRNNMNNMGMLTTNNTKTAEDINDKKNNKDNNGPQQNLAGNDDLFLITDPLNPYSSSQTTTNNDGGLHHLNLSSKYAPTTTIDTEALDFSKIPTFPHSPSVSVHILNSRASSRSSSCLGDEDLLDEGLVTLGK